MSCIEEPAGSLAPGVVPMGASIDTGRIDKALTQQGYYGVGIRENAVEWGRNAWQTGKANFWRVFRHSWGRRSASTWPNFWALLGKGLFGRSITIPVVWHVQGL